MKKILNFGSLNIDRVYKVDDFVRPGETKKSSEVNVYAGGKGLNQSLALAKAGADLYHAGIIGNDGVFLKEVLEAGKVDTSLIKTVDEQTGHAIIQVNDNGENCILLYGGTNDMIDREYVDYVMSNFNEGDIIVLQNEISELPYIIESADRKGLEVVLNPSPINENLKKIDLSKVSYILLNEIEGEALTGEKDFEKILDVFKNRYPELKVVLTLGSKGSIYSHRDERIHQNIYKVKAVDTTAAGDTFTGFFISNISRGMNVKDALDMSSKASAICVTRAGASVAIPTYDEVLNFEI